MSEVASWCIVPLPDRAGAICFGSKAASAYGDQSLGFLFNLAEDVAAAINRKTYQYRLFGESVDAEADSVAAARRSAQAGCFRSFVLWGEDQPVCFVLGHQRADGTFEHRQTGYDPAFRDCAPGIFCNIQLLQRLYARNRPTLLDFGSGDSDYKRLFSNESRTTANPILVPNLVRYRVLIWLFDASARFNMAVAGALQRWGVKDWIKRRLRGAR